MSKTQKKSKNYTAKHYIAKNNRKETGFEMKKTRIEIGPSIIELRYLSQTYIHTYRHTVIDVELITLLSSGVKKT